MIKNLQVRDINRFKRYIPFDTNNSSKLYYEKNLLHKIPNLINEKTINALKYIDKKGIKGTIKVTNFIKDKNKIVGYTVKKYNGYKSLKKCRYRKFSLKIKDCQKILKVFMYFNKNDLVYNDFHTGNVLLNKKTNDIKVCDLDSFRVSKLKSDKERQLLETIKLCVSYLYNLDDVDANIAVKHNIIKIDKDGYIRKCIRAIGTDEFLSRIADLNKINEKNLSIDRKQIKKEVREYIQAGYYNFF